MFVILLLCVTRILVSAETLFLQGSWEFYILCDDAYRPSFHTASNSIEVWRDLGNGRVIVRSTARMIDVRRGAALPMTIPPEMESFLSPWYKQDESKAAALNELARSIVGEAGTVETAVDRLNVWIRDNVSYSLGVSTDPLDVVRNRRAYCDGYASLAVALFRSVGIPALKLTCYIPPGHDWGFGSSGGSHAFFAYYYPEIGWICCDPQSSSGYVDPYHLVGFTGNIYAQYQRPPEAYVSGYSLEPKEWNTYSAAGSNNGVRGLALRMISPDEEFCYFSASLVVSKNNLKPSSSYFKQNMLGRSWFSADSGGVVLNADADRLLAYLDGSGWRSFFARPGLWPESGEELVAMRSNGMLGLRAIDLSASAFSVIDMSFSDGRSQSLRFYDPTSKAPLSNRTVKFHVDTFDIESETDPNGWLHLSILDSQGMQRHGLAITASTGGFSYTFVYDPGTRLVFPDQSAREAAVQSALAEFRSSSKKPHFRLVVRDAAGLADNSIVKAASLFDGATERRLIPRGSYFLAVEGIEPGKSYVLRARIGRVEVQRRIGPIDARDGYELELRQADLKPIRLWRENPFEAGDFTLYEYFNDKANPWPMAGTNGCVLWDCPEGEYLVSNNASRANVMRLSVAEGRDLAYKPSGMNLADFRFAEIFRRGTEALVVGRVREKTSILRTGSVFIVDEGGLYPRCLDTDERGFFVFDGCKPLSKYHIAFSSTGKTLLRTFTTDEKGSAMLDFDLEGKSITCATGEAWSRGGTDKTMLLVPTFSNGEALLKSFTLKTGKRFELYPDDAAYYLSTEATIMGATCLAAGTAQGRRENSGVLRLDPDRSEAGYIGRSRKLVKLAWPEAGDLVFIGFSGSEAGVWQSASVKIWNGAKLLPAVFDSEGFMQLRAAIGSEIGFSYSRRGFDWEGRLPITSSGPSVVELRPNVSNSICIQLKSSDRLWRIAPVRSSPDSRLDYRALDADSRGFVLVEGLGGGAWIKKQDGSILFCAFEGGKTKYSLDPAQDQAVPGRRSWANCFRAPRIVCWTCVPSERARPRALSTARAAFFRHGRLWSYYIFTLM
jgi:hypothetical protein